MVSSAKSKLQHQISVEEQPDYGATEDGEDGEDYDLYVLVYLLLALWNHRCDIFDIGDFGTTTSLTFSIRPLFLRTFFHTIGPSRVTPLREFCSF